MAEKGQFYQGDVMIEPVARIPQDATEEVPRENGLVILAKGEATGHHHAISEHNAKLFKGEVPNVCYLRIEGSEDTDNVTLFHQEHAPVQLKPGDYRIVIQKEYVAPDYTRQVED